MHRNKDAKTWGDRTLYTLINGGTKTLRDRYNYSGRLYVRNSMGRLEVLQLGLGMELEREQRKRVNRLKQ